MFFVLFLVFTLFLLAKGFFKIVLPVLLILLLLRLFFGGVLLLVSPHFLGVVLVIAFLIWLVRASRGGRRYY